MGSVCLGHHSWVLVLFHAPQEKGRWLLNAIIANCQIKSPKREAVTRLSIHNLAAALLLLCVPPSHRGWGPGEGISISAPAWPAGN